MKLKKQTGGILPNNIQEYLNKLTPKEKEAAVKDILEKQYSAYKNSPNQVNQQNMGSVKSLDEQLKELLMQYFQLKQIPENEQQMIMANYQNLTEEEKMTLLQELQAELNNTTQSTMKTGGKKKLYMKK